MSDTGAHLLPCVITFPEILLFQTDGDSINILRDDGALSSTTMACSCGYTKRWSINVHNTIFTAINALFIGHRSQQETSSSNTTLTLTTNDNIPDKLLKNHQLRSSAHMQTGLLPLTSSHLLSSLLLHFKFIQWTEGETVKSHFSSWQFILYFFLNPFA